MRTKFKCISLPSVRSPRPYTSFPLCFEFFGQPKRKRKPAIERAVTGPLSFPFRSFSLFSESSAHNLPELELESAATADVQWREYHLWR